jgi:ATP/maltotriose-dependent transcriptional regulator MalT
MLANGQLGLVLVLCGEVAAGMRLLAGAAAAAVAGEMLDAANAVSVCCMLTVACLSVRDLERAEQWSRYAMELAGDRGGGHLFDYPRVDQAALLMWRGRWAEAEQELRCVIDGQRGWSRPAALARLHLAELRYRQGRLDEATSLLDEVEATGSRAGLATLVATGRAGLACGRGDWAEAARLAEKSLRVLSAQCVTARIEPLAVLARARAALDQPDAARAAATELAMLASAVDTSAVRGCSEFAAASVARASGRAAEALAALEHAADLFAAAGMPFETAQAQTELAECLLDVGMREMAVRQARSAADVLDSLGAVRAAARPRKLLGRPDPSARGRPDLSLTRRELEVLGLLGQGTSNEDIATQLFLSVRTVEQHIANIYRKIGATGRTARAAATAFAHRNNIV